MGLQLALRYPQWRGFQLTQSKEQLTSEINAWVAEYSTDTCTLNAFIMKIQGDKDCDKADPLEYRCNLILPNE